MSQRSRRSSSAVTISDVAARAGVSAMTVSNVLGGRKKQDKVIERVRCGHGAGGVPHSSVPFKGKRQAFTVATLPCGPGCWRRKRPGKAGHRVVRFPS